MGRVLRLVRIYLFFVSCFFIAVAIFLLLQLQSNRSVHMSSCATDCPANVAVIRASDEKHDADRRVAETAYDLLENMDVEGKDLLYVSTRNITRLKSICTALTDCSGFNSNGWLKTHTRTNIIPSNVNLYIKQHTTKHDIKHPVVSNNPNHHEFGGRFGLFASEYFHMMDNMKIYSYDVRIGAEMPDVHDYKYGVDQLFISLLKKSKFNTQDPVEATFYFMPTRCFAYRRSHKDRAVGGHIAAATVRDIVNWVKVSFPYWNASRGSDHVYICSHDMGGECSQLADHNLYKNAIGLFNTADYSEPWFVPHKDISLPHHPSHGENSLPVLGRLAREGAMERTNLAFFAGNLKRGRVRNTIYSLYAQDSYFHLVHGYLPDEAYYKFLSTSKFCLIVRGFRAWSPRLLDAIWFGCVPVIVADWYALPLQGLIDWRDIAVFVPEAQVSKLKTTLTSLSPHKLHQMQDEIRKVSKHLTWNDPPQPFDAFHSVLFQLWTRRHITRTI